MRNFVILFSLLPLAACAPAEHTAKKLATDLRDNINVTSAKVKEWAMTPPPGKGALKPVKTSYCYTTLQDVLCYRQPMPGWEHRLVGYQGTGAEPPPPAMMQLMPAPPQEAALQPASRVAGAQPVFITPPPPVKDAVKDDAAAPGATPDSTHEQLPDPALAPQL